MDRASFLADRKQGVGGSDVAALFNIGYGCRLRLWYDKRGVEPDFPEKSNLAMELGQVLEPYFAERYAKETGHKCMSLPSPTGLPSPTVSPKEPRLRVNLDRVVLGVTGAGAGALEIKATGRAAFYKYRREGLLEDYILQLQAGMEAGGYEWGAFAIGCRDDGQLHHWEVTRDREVGKEIVQAVGIFWAQVENGPMPDRLEVDDPRCQHCRYRRSCQGNALIQVDAQGDLEPAEELRPLLMEYLSRKDMLDEATELVEETKEQLKTELGARPAVSVGNHKVYFRQQEGRTKYMGKEMAAAYDKLAEFVMNRLGGKDEAVQALWREVHRSSASYVEKTKPSRPLRVY